MSPVKPFLKEDGMTYPWDSRDKLQRKDLASLNFNTFGPLISALHHVLAIFEGYISDISPFSEIKCTNSCKRVDNSQYSQFHA